ncbi:hypothetical protein F4604DRAFT_1932950 [Suillus subluteus]|nr:hypothetical protein F4604DRAFT_1932950 [Suillus subluteus]
MLEPQVLHSVALVAQGAYLTGRSHIRHPLVFHTIALKLDTYPERLLRCQLEEEFSHCQNVLQCTNIELVTGAACLPNVRARVRNALAFVKAQPETDLLVLIDTHSDYENGELVHSVDKHGDVWTQNASELVRHYLGPELWKRSLDMIGTKGMILLACGPAFTKQSHFETIKTLVSRYDTPQPWRLFNDIGGFSKRLLFVIGFTAHSVQPSVVMPFMLRLIIQVYIHQMPVKQALEQEIAHWTLLNHTPVVLLPPPLVVSGAFPPSVAITCAILGLGTLKPDDPLVKAPTSLGSGATTAAGIQVVIYPNPAGFFHSPPNILCFFMTFRSLQSRRITSVCIPAVRLAELRIHLECHFPDIIWIISPSMVSTPVTYHGAPVLHEFQLPVLDSQPEFQAQQEVQTEPTLPIPAMKQDMPKHNALAESFLRSIQANFMCPICWDVIVALVTYCPEGHAVCVYCLLQTSLRQGFDRCPICRSNSSVPGNCPFIYLRGTQDAAVSLMEGIAREYRNVSEEDKDSQDEELRSYACGPIWDHWKVRSRVGLAVLHDIRQVQREVDFVDVGRVVSRARAQLAASAQLPSTRARLVAYHLDATSYRHIYTRPIAKLPAKVKPPSLVQQLLIIHASTILINNAGIDRVLEPPKGLYTHIITSHV